MISGETVKIYSLKIYTIKIRNYDAELLFSYLISRHLHQLEDLTLDYSMVTETGLNYIAGNSSNSNAKNSKLRRLSLQGCMYNSVMSFKTLI